MLNNTDANVCTKRLKYHKRDRKFCESVYNGTLTSHASLAKKGVHNTVNAIVIIHVLVNVVNTEIK